MRSEALEPYDPILFGGDPEEGIVAVEWRETKKDGGRIVVFRRSADRTESREEPFAPFMVMESRRIPDAPAPARVQALEGRNPLNACAFYSSWKDCLDAKDRLGKETGRSVGDPGSPYLFVNDPVQQHLVISGRTHFRGMAFEDLKRMQVDIECFTSEGYEFCNAEREGDRILAIGLGDQSGWVELLSGAETDEKSLLERFVALVSERDPDVIEGHNIFNFDLPYLAARAKRHGVKLALGRDGSVPRRRPSRFSVGERTLAYERFAIFGRHVVDTLFLAHAYDISHRSLDGFGLKEVAVHFGLASPTRTRIDGSKIASTFLENPGRVMDYLRDDVTETRSVSNLLSRSHFIQAQMLPFSYQNVCVRGSATRIDALMVREYLRQVCALPVPDEPREFSGGYTDMFARGVVKNVHHCDIRSLYPSLMLTRRIAPRSDERGVFLSSLDKLRTFRLEAKRQMQVADSPARRQHFEALQTAFKILINSFYGYLGFAQARFSDFDAAERVAEQGRALLRSMIEWLKQQGAKPVEIDTDGIYFVPPALETAGELEAFRRKFASMLPDGIEVEFDGEYEAMYSYKMKNYALLSADGEMIVKGAALKSRGLEPFQRAFVRELLRLRLEGRESETAALKSRYERSIRDRAWPIDMLAKTETLQDAPSTYAAKVGQSRRGRGAAYELALRSGRDYRAGDPLTYYVTGNKKTVAVHGSAKLISEWNPEARDENVEYYLAKLNALYAKFVDADGPDLFEGITEGVTNES